MTKINDNNYLNTLTPIELANLKVRTTLLWKEYFENFKNKYSKTYKIMSDAEQKYTLKLLTEAYLEYKYNPLPADEEEFRACQPYYRYTENKNEIHLITKSLDEIFKI